MTENIKKQAISLMHLPVHDGFKFLDLFLDKCMCL